MSPDGRGWSDTPLARLLGVQLPIIHADWEECVVMEILGHSQISMRWATGGRTLNQRIKSLSGRGSPGFLSVRAAGQTAYAYPCELGRTAANCNPNCNPE